MADEQTTTIYTAAAVRDAAGLAARPGAVAVRGGGITAAGTPQAVAEQSPPGARRVDLADRLLLPALVNAHAHLDLTNVGPVPYEGDFARWLGDVVRRRLLADDAIEQAVRRGLAMCWQAGTGYLGDVARWPSAVRARIDATAEARPEASGGDSADSSGADGSPHDAQVGPMPGVSYLEVTGLGQRQGEAVEQLKGRLATLPFESPAVGHSRGIVVGIQPHAPYSTGRRVYREAVRLSHARAYRLCTHLAESPAELQFVRDATGPLADLLRDLSAWDPAIGPTGLHPVDYLARTLLAARWLLVHCNYVEDAHIALFRRARASVVYCPVASDYFRFPGQGRAHRYRDMLAAGVNVCLGTDSILCQPPDEPQPMGILPQMRHLYRRDGAEPELLLKMATVNGLLALEIEERGATLQPGTSADIIAVRIDPDDGADPLVQALTHDEPVERIC